MRHEAAAGSKRAEKILSDQGGFFKETRLRVKAVDGIDLHGVSGGDARYRGRERLRQVDDRPLICCG
jgi:hypothetical protein